MERLFALNRLRWPIRIPLKWALFGLTVIAVCFPSPSRLADHIRHWRDPNALIEPDAPALQPLLEELTQQLNEDLSPRETLRATERFVYKKIPYEWDWNTWGMADYLPTVSEVIGKGKEDCDGRAVVAASLLSGLGFQAEIVTDFAHVWVKTEHGETMGPGKQKSVIATRTGLKVQRGALAQLPKALAYGIAPFPLVRELIVILAMWLLLLRHNGGAAWSVVALVFMVAGLLIMRAAGKTYLHPVVWMQLTGAASLLAGVLMLFVFDKDSTRRTGGAPARDPDSVTSDG